METVVKKTCQLGVPHVQTKPNCWKKTERSKEMSSYVGGPCFYVYIRSSNVFQQVTAALLTKQNDLCLWLIPVVC